MMSKRLFSDDGLSGPELARRAREAAAMLRLGRDAEGWHAFTQFLDALVRGVDPGVLAAMAPWLLDAQLAQTRGDTLRVADVLNARIAPLCEDAA